MIGAFVGAALTYQDPDFKVKFLGPQMVETIDHHKMWTHSIVAIKPLASSSIMTNNIGVGFTTFALGVTGGIGTIYMMLFNGMLMGVIGVACGLAGMSLDLWSFVAPHGVLELPAIFIAGGAGFRVAQGLLFPGVLPRRESLARAGTLRALQSQTLSRWPFRRPHRVTVGAPTQNCRVASRLELRSLERSSTVRPFLVLVRFKKKLRPSSLNEPDGNEGSQERADKNI